MNKSVEIKVNKERLELEDKINKLKEFLNTHNINFKHKTLLKKQLRTMKKYDKILIKRLKLFSKEGE